MDCWIGAVRRIDGMAHCRGRDTGPAHDPVRVMDGAEVPADTLNRAQADATRVFHLSGIALVWVDAETCQAGCLTVRIVTQPVSAKSRDPHMLGVAPSTSEARGINLWVFYPRIRAYSAELGMDASRAAGPCDGPRVGSSVATRRRPFGCRFHAADLGYPRRCEPPPRAC